MKQRYISGCEFCDTWFWDQVDCEQHEAEHFNLTRREYLDWRLFHRKAIQTGFNCGCNNNERTKQELSLIHI